MHIKYLLVDDAPISQVRSYADALQAAKPNDYDLVIEARQPDAFDDLVAEIRHKHDFDGLILDLHLDQQPNEHQETVKYTAQALAQELRTRMSSPISGAKLKSVPIVLWSVDARLRDMFSKDDTAQDLFDAVYLKNEDIEEKPIRVSLELCSFAASYKIIRSELINRRGVKNFLPKILRLKDGEESAIDPRIFEPIDKTNTSVHEVAKYVQQEIVGRSGPLVDEALMAARLGVDRSRSHDWPKLRAVLSEFSYYHGAFSLSEERWWWPTLEKWWVENAESEIPLRSLTAEERVNALIKITNFKKLSSAKPELDSYSSKFWTVCLASGIPLDPRDGLRASDPSRLPWQDIAYLSVSAVLERKAKKAGFTVDQLDLPKVDAIRKANR